MSNETPAAQDLALTDTIELKGKSAIFFGDSVAYGHTTDGNGFGYYINAEEKFSHYKNAAVSTATINTVTQGTNNIIEQIKQNKDDPFDFVILQGGFGDLRDTPPLGSLTEGYSISKFDTETFAGAVEYTLYLAVTYWPDARIGYIISYDTPNSKYGVRPDHSETKKYWDIVKSACHKWNIEYLDLFEGSAKYQGETRTYSELFEVTSNKYLAKDHIHPTAKGYQFICSFLADWMKTLPVYEQDFEIITKTDRMKTLPIQKPNFETAAKADKAKQVSDCF